MWARSRLSFSLASSGSCPTQRHSICRYLRTQCTDFHPRGLARCEGTGRRGGAQEGVAQTDQPRPAHPTNHRSVDAMDPVVLKYTNMMNEMRSQVSGIERVNATHFGSIRFDNENIPLVHGQYDEQHGPEARQPSTQGAAARVYLQLHDNGGQSKVLKICEPEPLHSHDGLVDSKEYQNILNKSEEQLKAGDKYIRQHFTESSTSESKDKVIMSESDIQKYNYIDACMFGDSLPFTPKKLEKPLSEYRRNSTVSDGEICVNDVDDNLNYVDKVFFKNSLENLEVNRQPAIDYSEIKKDLENAVLSGKDQVANEGSERNYGGDFAHVTKRNEQESSKDKDKTKEQSRIVDNREDPKSAFEYVVRMRRENMKKQYGLDQKPGDGSNKSYKKILSLVNEKSKARYTRHEVLKSLKSSILYNDNDIVGLYKPYGMAMHSGSDSQHHILLEYLPELADFLQTEALYPVHRLDASTTGVTLLARTPAMAATLKRMFKERQLKKTYLAITKGIPDPMQGLIDIPVAEGLVDGRRRMVLKPDVKGYKSTTSSSKTAVTRFKVLSKRDNAALVELSPMTGVRHQLRVHLAFGLSCPVLGDHKYSHIKKMAPQALPGDVLDKLKIKQSKVRNLPLFLHCKSIIVPEIVDGRNISIHAKIPAYFNKALSLLKLNRYESKVKLDELMASLS